MNPRIRNSVSIVKLSDNDLEFFLSDIRKIKRLKVNNVDLFLKVIRDMDGKKSIEMLAKRNNISERTLDNLVKYLSRNSLLIDSHSTEYEQYPEFKRVINFLSNYAENQNLDILWSNVRNSKVVVVGVGTVGSWVAINLVQSGVKHIMLVDDDRIEASNLPRQAGYFENQIGMFKIDALKSRLMSMQSDLKIEKRKNKVNSANQLDRLIGDYSPQLVINTADYPSVDKISTIIGEYCMPRKIPHIIGGGYNLHTSLIGQTIIPFKSACMKCIEKQFNQSDDTDFSSLKKMVVPNRKIGNLGPASHLIGSFIGMEAIKVLSRALMPANLNRRGEFDILHMKISFQNYKRDKYCEWCGVNGKFTQLE